MRKFYDSEYLPAGASWKLPPPKAYFIQLLPATGKIQERLKALYAPSHKEYKAPIKLFLCSRDVKVGDTCFYVDVMGQEKECTFKEIALFEGDTEWWFDFGTKDMSSYHPGYDKNRKPPYKVIGEISPQASWVTEGMEFDLNQLAFYLSSVHTEQSYNIDLEGFLKSTFKGKKYIKIKCPHCGTFH